MAGRSNLRRQRADVLRSTAAILAFLGFHIALAARIQLLHRKKAGVPVTALRR
ncbi:hypothetical protein [Micromonospora sp. NPDC001898]|uniref:hypothetical protein n=1 Tax=Micromonospora sp. NPDC001898 TaxID=3364221 RepID=UPI0036C8C379